MYFERSVRCGFLASTIAPSLSPFVSTVWWFLYTYVPSPMSRRICATYQPCLVVNAIAIYSTSVIVVDTAVCFLLPQKTRPPLIRPMDIVILFLSSRSLVQSVSEYTTRLPVGPNLIRAVTKLRRYRNNCRRACTCRSYRSYIYQLRRPRAYVISSLVYTIKYIIEPIRSRYSVRSVLISSSLDKLRLVSILIIWPLQRRKRQIQTGFTHSYRPALIQNHLEKLRRYQGIRDIQFSIHY